MAPIHLLHVFPSFETGGAQARTVTLMNALGPAFRHSVVAMNGDFSASLRIDQGVIYETVATPSGAGSVSAVRHIAALLKQLKPDLLLTYNWGAIEAVMGNILAPVCPVVHVEDGFGPDEASCLKARRVWTRRIVLRRASCMAVPSRTLERIALDRYRLPRKSVQFIPNGVDTSRFLPSRNSALRASLGLAPDAFVIGTVGRLRPEKDLATLVRRFGQASIPGARLLFVGDGPSRPVIQAAVDELGLSSHCVFAGEVADPAPFYGVFDLFAMTSITEQMPIGLLEAMSSGLPVLCTDAGDTAAILEGSPSPQVLPRFQPDQYVENLRALAADPERRLCNARWNRERVVSGFSLDAMVSRWDHLYRQAANMPPPPAGQHQDVP
jgi:glycosyltransferase involved in cell wall biosynthesis